MKILHLSDLHIGKAVHGYSMLEDQEYVLAEIVRAAEQEQPDAIFIAGDVYDKSVPSNEAIGLWDRFITELSGLGMSVFVINGNHDAPEKVSYYNALVAGRGVYLAPVYDGTVRRHTLEDEFGPVDIYLLPFVKPAHVRHYYPEEKIETYNDALRVAVSKIELDKTRRNVILAHQFITGAATSESEVRLIGGLENVEAGVFDDFDYVAMGHLHRPQNIGTSRIRYAGSPLQYSRSEITADGSSGKSMTIATLSGKPADSDEAKYAELSIREIPIKPLRRMVEIRGGFAEITEPAYYEGTDLQDAYVFVTLTDQEPFPNADRFVSAIYHHKMGFEYGNLQSRSAASASDFVTDADKDPLEVFRKFYEMQAGAELSQEQEALLKRVVDKVWEVADETD